MSPSDPANRLVVLQYPAASAAELVVAVPTEETGLSFRLLDTAGGSHRLEELPQAAARAVVVDLVRVKNASVGAWSRPSDSRMTVGANLPLWHLPDAETVYLYSKAKEAWKQASVDLVSPAGGRDVVVAPRREYVFRVLAATHRCNGRVEISVLDEQGERLTSEVIGIDPRQRGGESRELFHAIEARVSVPERGHAIRVRVQKSATTAKRDSYLFLADPRLHEVHEGGAVEAVSVTEEQLAELHTRFGARLPALRRARLRVPSSIASIDSREVRLSVTSAEGEHVGPPTLLPTVSLPGELRGVLNGVAFGYALLPAQEAGGSIVATCQGTSCAVTVDEAPDAEDEVARSTFRVELGDAARAHGDAPLRLEIVRAGTLESMAGSPFTISNETRWGELDGVLGMICAGWATSWSAMRPSLELVVDGEVVRTFAPDEAYTPFVASGLSRARVGFGARLPERALDGESHVVSVRFAGSGQPLKGGTRTYRFEPHGTLGRVERGYVEGWFFDAGSEDAPVELEVILDGSSLGTTKTTLRRTDVAQAHGRHFVGFHLNFDASRLTPERPFVVEVRIAGTEKRVLGPARVTCATTRTIEGLEQWAAGALRDRAALEAPVDLEAFVRELLRTRVVPEVLEEWRAALRRGSGTLAIDARAARPRPDASRPVDVIIPVYKGFSETLACIESVLGASTGVAHRVVVLNDASPDGELAEALRALGESGRVVLIENAENLGFVATVNRGMRSSESNDVVLLNSDTVVPDGWLDALVEAAHARADIGTVTPLSNRATICSVPLSNFDNEMPNGFDVGAMNRLCREHGGGGLVDIPTAIGFCMYIRRDVIDEVGFFDEIRWKKGYCEENDFCVKARARGYRSFATTSCFVQHHGSVSFGGEKLARVRENLAVLEDLYPDYHAGVHAWIARDPIRPYRNRINAALLAASGTPHVLHVLHALGGGTVTAVEQMTTGLETNGYASLLASPVGESGMLIRNTTGTVSLTHDLAEDGAALGALLRSMNVELVHVHHVAGFEPALFPAIRGAGIPYVVTIHDYFFACPRVDLLDSNGTFCDLPDAGVCGGCVHAAPVPAHATRLLDSFEGDVARWRRASEELLRGARAVFAPSDDTQRRIARAFPDCGVTRRAHPDRRELRVLTSLDVAPHSIAVLGAIGDHKGYAKLLGLARHAEAVGSPLRFTIVGYTRDDSAFESLENVYITGKYEAAELATLVRDSRASIALFLSPWSETYSYTLSDAFELGLYPVALDRGAFPERIEEARFGEVIPPEIGVAALHDHLLAVCAKRESAKSGPVDPWRRSPDFYYEGVLEAGRSKGR